jgi:uncharacterized radical SAM superfamily Fe-S cluster-containing enzyme
VASDMRRLPDADYVYVGLTRSACHHCQAELPDEIRLVDAEIIIRSGRVYLRKHCPTHGLFETLKASDAEWYLNATRTLTPGSPSLAFSTEVRDGCPADCGLCPRHHQHVCSPVIDLSDKCDMLCPICNVRNAYNYTMTLEEFDRVLDALERSEGTLKEVILSGGEPAIHPRILDFIERARARGTRHTQVLLNTNGLRVSRDDRFVEALARLGVTVNLQFDGYDPAAWKALRGKDYSAAKMAAIERLERFGVATALDYVIGRGINEGDLGRVIRELLVRPFVRSLIVQPISHTGTASGWNADPTDYVTIPDVLRLIEEQTGGYLTAADFGPGRCSHPECCYLVYLVSHRNRLMPVNRLLDGGTYGRLIQNQFAVLYPEAQTVFSAAHVETPFTPPPDHAETSTTLAEQANYKQIVIHHFMDAYTFDLARAMKCCWVYPQGDGRLMPMCTYNVFHRHRDMRARTAARAAATAPGGEP